MLYASYRTQFHVDVARKQLKQFDEYASGLNIEYCMVGGTLLGYVRHGSLMSWDDDIDLLMLDSDILRLWDVISLRYDCAQIVRNWEDHSRFFDWFARFEKEGIVIDVWPMRISGNHIETFIGKFPTDKTFPYQRVDFAGSFYSIPSDPFYYLDMGFPDWRTKILKRVDGHGGSLISTENFYGPIHHQT